MDVAGLPARLQRRLARGRAAAEARMGAAHGGSDARVRRKSATPVRNPDTGYFEQPWIVTHANLPFRLGGPTGGAGTSRTLTSGGVEVERAVRIGSMPHDTTDLADGDLIDLMAGEHVGLVLRIVDATGKDQATARRVEVVETARPVEWG